MVHAPIALPNDLLSNVYLRSIRVSDREAYVHASQRLEEVDGCIQRGNFAVKAKCSDRSLRHGQYVPSEEKA
jgi:hypothetical protein